MVRFLTRRFIWEYDPTLGKTLPAFTATAAATLPLSPANAKKMTLLLPSATEKLIGGQSSLLDARMMDGSHYLYLELPRGVKKVCWEVNVLLSSTWDLLFNVMPPAIGAHEARLT